MQGRVSRESSRQLRAPVLPSPSLFPAEQTLANVLGVKSKDFADAPEGKEPIALFHEPVLRLPEQNFFSVLVAGTVFLEVGNRKIQYRQHKTFFLIVTCTAANRRQIQARSDNIGLKENVFNSGAEDKLPHDRSVSKRRRN